MKIYLPSVFLVIFSLQLLSQSTNDLTSANGKYEKLITKVYCPDDVSTYGDFQDYGYYSGGAWCNQNTPAGYWVWVKPNWYIWEKEAPKNSQSTNSTLVQDPKASETRISFINNLIASSPQSYSPEKFSKYFFFNDEIWDVNSMKKVKDNVPASPIVSIGKNLISAVKFPFHKKGSILHILDQEFNKVHELSIPGYLSWNRQYCIELINGDLWRSDINPATGKLENKRQVTELGVFNYDLNYFAWIGDLLVFTESFGKPQFILNTKTKELKYFSSDGSDQGVKLELRFPTSRVPPPNPVFSPDLIRCYTSAEKDFSISSTVYIYDFNNQQGYGPFESGFWLSSRFYALRKYLPSNDPGYLVGPPAFDVIDLQTGKVESLCEDCDPSIFSPNQQYGIEISYQNQNSSKTFIHDFQSQKRIEWSPDAIDLFVNNNGQYLNPIKWLDNENVMYVQSGDLINQGTFIFNLKTGNSKRLQFI